MRELRVPVGTLCCLLAVATAVVISSQLRVGELAMERSDAAFDVGDVDAALGHAQVAASAYVPGAPHVVRARERVEAIALGSLRSGQEELGEQAGRVLEAMEVAIVHPAVWGSAQAPRRAVTPSVPLPVRALLGTGFLVALVGGWGLLTGHRGRRRLVRSVAPAACVVGVLACAVSLLVA